ncbi:hypothetical protein ASD62_18985 [Phycicoccus sp. Root563]|uniref:hypothetical protein n=1 Tax=Phycicoccus sp. Root563 TaxID=1736562 RepID=UPI0007030E83|nr:hypothetical protein [Phycicoccus sp. Root563]KQZ87635.1 hypothetical protein ASD62_18985 [Phycicoccus sp. Root563]
MDRASFHKLRLAVQENANPADDHHVAALQATLQKGLVGSRLFAEVELGRTQDVDRMIIGICRCADDVAPWEAGVGVERLWGVAALDTRWEIHLVSANDGYMEFEGAVTTDAQGRYVTVNLVAEPARVPDPTQAQSVTEGTDGPPPRSATIDA